MPAPVGAHTGRTAAPRERGRGQQCADLRAHLRHPFDRNPIRLGEGDRAAIEAHQIQDREMLAGLGHHPVVGGDHQQPEVDAATPASMLRMNFSCPGTSTKPSETPSPKSR